MPRRSQDTCSQSTCPTFYPFSKILHHLLSETSLIIDQGSHISCKWATRYLNRKDVEYDGPKEMRATQVCEECRRSVGRSLWVGCERKKICGSKWGPCKREEVSVGGEEELEEEKEGGWEWTWAWTFREGVWVECWVKNDVFFSFSWRCLLNFSGPADSLSCVLLSQRWNGNGVFAESSLCRHHTEENCPWDGEMRCFYR